MGQQISFSNLNNLTLIPNNLEHADKILTNDQIEDTHLFLPSRVIDDINKNLVHLSDTKQNFIKQIRTDLLGLTSIAALNELNTDIATIVNQVFEHITLTHTNFQDAMQSENSKQRLLQESYDEKLKDDKDASASIFTELTISSFSSETALNEQRNQQLLSFGAQSLVTLFMMLLKSIHKYDSTIIGQMLESTNQLIEQIPLNYFSIDVHRSSSSLYKTLKPLIDYLNDLSIHPETDPMMAHKTVIILLKFAIIRASLKDLFPIIRKLIFNTTDIYDIRILIAKLNNTITQINTDNSSQPQEQSHTASTSNIAKTVEFLESINAFPNTKLMELDTNKFTGQFVSFVLLAHINLHNQLNSEQQFERNSMNSSFSFELGPSTFKYLYEIIKPMITEQSIPNHHYQYIVDVCLRLFLTHLKFLVEANIDNFHLFINANDVAQWHAIIIQLASNDESIERKSETSKALMYLIEKQTSSFAKTLHLIYRSIIDSKHPVLIEQSFNQLSNQIFINKWIAALCDNECLENKTLASTILHELIDRILKPNEIDSNKLERLKSILFKFQDLFLVYINNQNSDVSNQLEIPVVSTIGVDYLTHILKYSFEHNMKNILLEPCLIGLCVLTESKFNFSLVQPIFTSVAPLLAEYLTKKMAELDNRDLCLMSWLLGKMCFQLINGPQLSPLEQKYSSTLGSPLFYGGYEISTTENDTYLSNLFKADLTLYSHFVVPYRRQQSVANSDFLFSIYNNSGQGAQLISRMKLFVREKQKYLQPSIECEASEAFAATFAVYIKHFRRIDLAQYESTQPNDKRPHEKILSLYEYANHVRTVFATTKARGGDCTELCKRIKEHALFLITSVKESSFIPMIKDDCTLPIITSQRPLKLQRQISHWTKAKCILRLLRNALHACIKLKYLMLERKQVLDKKKDNESILHHDICSCLYGYDNTKSTINNDSISESDDMKKCLIRQYQRAVTRLITYQFVDRFINNNDANKQIVTVSTIILMNLKNASLDWHYLENIQASSSHLKENIGERYYTIVKKILTLSNESSMRAVLMTCAFNMMNLGYDSMDLCHLNNFQYIQDFFKSFVSFTETNNTDNGLSVDMKLAIFNWFRLVVLRLCETIELESQQNMNLGSRKFHRVLQQQCYLIFRQLILTELKQFEQKPIENATEQRSLKNISLNCFITRVFNAETTINQYLALLLRCIHLYEYIRLHCATFDYIEYLWNLYERGSSHVTRLLALKILRDLLVVVPEHSLEQVHRSFIENVLMNILLTIGQYFNTFNNENESTAHIDHVIELIYIFRTILSNDSSWQKPATQMIINAIQMSIDFNMKSLESIDQKHMNNLLASLCIFGGYVRPYCLGSTVEIYSVDRSIDQLELATIIEINTAALESEALNVTPYLVQYANDNRTEWVSLNQLRTRSEVSPPNLVLLPIDNAVHIILDTLGWLSQSDVPKPESLILLQIKRRAIISLYALLNHKAVVDIFVQKPYVSIITKLSMSLDYLNSKVGTISNDLRLFNRLHVEQFYLSLDRCARTKKILEDKLDENTVRDINGWNKTNIYRDPLIIDYLTKMNWLDNGWKPIVNKNDLLSYKRGKSGDNEFNIISVPPTPDLPPLEDCGEKHVFKGRINITDDSGNIRYPSFILDNMRFTEGKWYFCVRVLLGGSAQIGWGTDGFTPAPAASRGIGDDLYSWGYDGSRGVCYHGQSTNFCNETRWDADDICGCGIEIDGVNTNIKYWLNGRFLGTAFSHSTNDTIQSTIKADLLPNGPATSYFAGVTVQVNGSVANTGAVNFIFNPEDMIRCPLPNGYKPLFTPTLLTMENIFVGYPFSAYLICDDLQQCIYKQRCLKEDTNKAQSTLLRDFVNEEHFETSTNCDHTANTNHLLSLSEDSDGFLLPIENCAVLTVSFDFELAHSNEDENQSKELDIVLFSIENEMFSLRINILNMNDSFFDETARYRQRVAIIFQKDQHTKVYVNNAYQTMNYSHRFDPTEKSAFNLRILPYLNAGIRNIGVWKYGLSEEHISRLFTYGLQYVTVDYQRLSTHKQYSNTLTFKKEQKHFTDSVLIPFNEPFIENVWHNRQQMIDHDESVYFKSMSNIDRSVVQLFGNKSYLVLNTANQIWPEYTLVLDIFIPNLPSAVDPSASSQLTLVTLDDNGQIFITKDGHICISGGQKSLSPIKLECYNRLLISVQLTVIHICVNGVLELNVPLSDDRFVTKLKRIDLFREGDLSKNTTNEDQLRVECQSITYLNHSIDIFNSSIKELIQSSEYPLEKLVNSTFSIPAASLMGIGYKEELIEFVMKQYNTTKIQVLDTILREEAANLERIYATQREEKFTQALLRLKSYDSNDTLSILSKIMMNKNDELAPMTVNNLTSEQEWFHATIQCLGFKNTLADWLVNKGRNTNGRSDDDSRTRIINLQEIDSDGTHINQTAKKKATESLHYVHQQIRRKVYTNLLVNCEYGLITIYARYTILNILKVWCNNGYASTFPLWKFADHNLVVTLLRLMDYHCVCTRTHIDDNLNRMNVVAMSILKVELKELMKSLVHEKINVDILNRKAPLFYHTQKHIMNALIDFTVEPSLIDTNAYNDETVDERMIIKQSNVDFILKIVGLFLELLQDPEMRKFDIDLRIRLLFPDVFIRVMFDLFLLASSHQLKIFVLQLFTKLVESSKNFKLHDDIQNFVLQLFIELVSNKIHLENVALTNLRNATMHFVLAAFQRPNEVMPEGSECAIMMQNLLLVIDLIRIFTSKSKHFQWPDLFFIESKEILGDKLALNKEAVDAAQTYFDFNSDRQIIEFMNQNINLGWYPLPNESLNQYIESLPIETTPNPAIYSAFTNLSTIPPIYIQTRITMFYLFNIIIERILPLIDLTSSHGTTLLTDLIRSARSYILYTTKFHLLNEALTKTASATGVTPVDVPFDTIKASAAKRPEDTMFYQAYKSLREIASIKFRLVANENPWKAIFIGMHSIDQGGPFRDSLSRICDDLCSTRLRLFVLCPNGRMNSGLNRDRWIPNVFPPNRPIPDEFKNQYRFIGQLMGMSIRTKNLLDLRLPHFLWKQLVNDTVTIEDIEAIDIQSFTIINEMEKNIRQVSSLGEDGDENSDRDYLFSSIMSELTFDVVSSTGQTYELVPGGFHMPITAANFEEYCMRYREYRLNEFHRQIEFIRQGLYSVVPWAYLTLYTARELEEAICGKVSIDIELLKRNTSYSDGISDTSPHIESFWTVLSKMFSEEQKKLFLIFVWGRSTLPSRDEDFSQNLVIAKLNTSDNVDQTLPMSHTCFFTLDLPEYSTTEIMYERLKYAITHCCSIDGDSTMNE